MLDTHRQFMVQRQCTCWTHLDSSWCKDSVHVGDTQTVHGAKTVYMLDTLRQFMVQRQCTCWTHLDSSWCKDSVHVGRT